jgi:hypothetical protein
VEIQSVTLKSIPTGITQQREISGIRVWPNPFINYLNFNSDETVVQIEVANINGELVYIQKERNSGHFQIHPDVHPGFYFIKAKFENGDIQNLAVIKQN